MFRNISLLVAAILVIGALTYYTLCFQWPGDKGQRMAVAERNQQRDRQMILENSCSGCHIVSSVRQATGRVGPKLEDIREQIYLAGVVPYQPENMLQWLMNPREISPQTAMPDLDATEQYACSTERPHSILDPAGPAADHIATL